MKYLIVLLVSLGLLMGCQNDEPVDEPTDPKPVEEEKESDETGETDQEETSTDDIEEEKDEPTEESSEEQESATDEVADESQKEQVSEEEKEAYLSVDEAREIVENNLATSIELMQQLQEEKQDWFGMVEGTDEYKDAVEVTKAQLSETISSHVMNEWAEYYLQEFFIYNHFLAVLQPNSLNTRFNLEMSSSNQFTFSFIQLGDAAYNETLKYSIQYFNEAGSWKFAGYEVEDINEPLNLTFEDLEEAFMDGQTHERFKGSFVEEMEHEGESYIVIDYSHSTKAINVNTGYDESHILN